MPRSLSFRKENPIKTKFLTSNSEYFRRRHNSNWSIETIWLHLVETCYVRRKWKKSVCPNRHKWKRKHFVKVNNLASDFEHILSEQPQVSLIDPAFSHLSIITHSTSEPCQTSEVVCFAKNRKWALAVNYFRRTLHVRCLTRFWILFSTS